MNNNGSGFEEFFIVNTQFYDNFFGDFSNIIPNAVTGENVRVGEFSGFGMGANILHKVQIRAHSLIRAGSVVIKNADAYSVLVGEPAKVIKSNKSANLTSNFSF